MPNFDLEIYALSALRILTSVGNGRVRERALERRGIDILMLTAIIEYADGSALNVRVLLDGLGDFVDWAFYSFNYMRDNGDCVFRYDNSSHYPSLHTFPHHKHEGADESVSASDRPSIRQIRNEIADRLSANP